MPCGNLPNMTKIAGLCTEVMGGAMPLYTGEDYPTLYMAVVNL